MATRRRVRPTGCRFRIRVKAEAQDPGDFPADFPIGSAAIPDLAFPSGFPDPGEGLENRYTSSRRVGGSNPPPPLIEPGSRSTEPFPVATVHQVIRPPTSG